MVNISLNDKSILILPNSVFSVIYHAYIDAYEQHPELNSLLREAIIYFQMASSGTYFDIEESLPNYKVALAFYNIAKQGHHAIENNPITSEVSKPLYRKFYQLIEDRAKTLAIAENKKFIF